MKHLIKFNEKSFQELTFDTFKEIINSDISDDFNYNIEFDDFSSPEEYEKFYDCKIDLYGEISYEIQSNYNCLVEILPDFESPEALFDQSRIFDEIDNQISELEKVKANIDSRIKKENDIRKLFDVLINKTIPRLDNFQNCREVTIGYDDFEQTLRICFEIVDKNTLLT